jgi:hypothetical protein
LSVAASRAAGDGRSFLRAFFITGGMIGLVLALSPLFFIRSGENWPYEALVARQLESDGVFAPAAPFGYFEYKLELVKATRPTVLVVGSSRALGFRGKYFTVPFMNAGMAMLGLEEGRLFLSKMLQFHKPKYAILVLDFWWFNPVYPPNEIAFGRFKRSNFTRDLAVLPFDSVLKGKLAAWQLSALALFGYRKNSLTAYENFGITGVATSNGIRADGSMLYSDLALAGRVDFDPKFARHAEMIQKGLHNYAWADSVDHERFDQLGRLVQMYQDAGIGVFLVIPPVAPLVHELLVQSGHYRYISELQRQLPTVGVPIFDFHDPSLIPATNCEFVDGYHSGDITYLKMLMDISLRSPSIHAVLSVEKALKTIAEFDGNIIDQSDNNRFRGRPEVDFMGFGCHRRPSPQAN